MQNTDNQIEKIIQMLIESPLSAYKIAKQTGISVQTIINYRRKKSIPNKSNLQLLEYYFSNDNSINNSKNFQNSISGSNNIIGDNSHIDQRQFYSDSPDVLKKEIELLDERIKEKDAQIKEKDALISRLLSLVEKQSAKKCKK